MQACFFSFILFLWQLNSVFAQPAEKILLNTDKQWYYPGEPIRYAVNTFDACGDSLAQLSSVAYVELVGTDAKPVIQSKLKVEHSLGKGSMLIGDNIASGSYNVVAYTSWMKNFGPAVFARKAVYIVNPARPGTMNTSYSLPDEQLKTSNTISLETSRKKFAKRESVKVNFSVGKPARVSVSVYRTDGLEKGAEKIYMSQVPDPCNAHPRTAPFIFEKRGHVVLGKVIDRRTQSPAGGIRGYLSSVDYPDHLFVATSDSTGNIRFEVGDLPGKTELVLNTDAATQNNYIIELVSPYADNTTSLSEKGNDNVFESSPRVIDEAMMSAQVQKIFARRDSLPRVRDSINMYPFYGKPDAFYLISDYVHFSTVEEILREYIYSIAVQSRSGKLRPIVIDLLTEKPFADQPLILVNGIPLYDVDQFMQMNSDEFYSIAVVARKYFMGHQVFYGIIDVRLNTSLKEFGANARVMDYDGTEINTEIVLPDYSNELKRVDRKPDFRNVLYWNPLVETVTGNGSVEFYTSDLEGEYVVVVQAISRDGQVSMSKSTIEVK